MVKYNIKVNEYRTNNRWFTDLDFTLQVKNVIRKLLIVELVLIDKIELLKDILEK